MSAWVCRTIGAFHLLTGGLLFWIGFASAPARGLFSGAKSLQEFGAVGLVLGGLALIIKKVKLAQHWFWAAFGAFLLLTVFAWFSRVEPLMLAGLCIGAIGTSTSFLTACYFENKCEKGGA